jgi:phosphoglycolate phosphatase-like HAD superfamily hydrolase
MTYIVFVDLDNTLIQSLDNGQEYRKVYEKALERDNSSSIDQRMLALRKNRAEQWDKALPFPYYGPQARVAVREGAEKFLKDLSEDCELHILTSADSEYARNALMSAKLDSYIDKVMSVREEFDVSWVSGKPWVLIDDLEAPMYKLNRLPSRCWGHLELLNTHFVNCDMFTIGQIDVRPLDFYVPLVRDKLTCQALSN